MTTETKERQHKMKKRIITHSHTLGINEHVFKMKKGEIIEVGEKDKFSRMDAIIQGTKVYAYWSTIDRISAP